jgi:hypothetical protein
VPRVAEVKLLSKELKFDPKKDELDLDTMIQLSIGMNEATVDFKAGGSLSRILNRGIPFFNVAFQSPRAQARAAKRAPLQVHAAWADRLDGDPRHVVLLPQGRGMVEEAAAS